MEEVGEYLVLLCEIASKQIQSQPEGRSEIVEPINGKLRDLI